MQCTNHLKQWALAAHTHAEAYKGWFNIGGNPDNPRRNLENGKDYYRISWPVELWPFVEQQQLFAAYDMTEPFHQNTLKGGGAADASQDVLDINIKTCRKTVPAYYCPSDAPNSNQGTSDGYWRVMGNYVTNMGNTHLHQDAEDQVRFLGAPYGIGHVYSLGSIKDGTSNTAFFSEIIIASPGNINDNRGDILNNEGSPGFMSYQTPNSSDADRCRNCAAGTNPSDDKFKRKIPCIVAPEGNTRVRIAARSNHTGGVNLSLCDGSVQFASDTVSMIVWEAVLTANGGESQTL